MDELVGRVTKLEERVNELEALQKFDSDVQTGMIRALEEDIEEVQEILSGIVEKDAQWPSTVSEQSTE